MNGLSNAASINRSFYTQTRQKSSETMRRVIERRMQFIIDHRRSLQVGLCCGYNMVNYAKHKYGEDRKSCKVKQNQTKQKQSCVLLRCDGSHLSSQWYPPCCPLSVQPTSFKRKAYQMGFSLKARRQTNSNVPCRDSSPVRNHTPKPQTVPLILPTLQTCYRSEAASDFKFCAFV